jgi:hypothetical protein
MIVNTIVQSKITLPTLLFTLSLGCAQRQPPPLQTAKVKIEHVSPIIAIVGTKAIRQEDLWNELIELAGSEIVQDAINSAHIELALAEKALVVRQKNIEQEWEYLLRAVPSLNKSSFKNQLKEKGIGEKRLRSLLWRTSALRMLIEQDVSVTEEQVRRMYEIMHGPAYPVKIIVLPTLKEANQMHAQLKRGASFSELANTHSIDPSASLGGDIGSITIADPIWPEPIRKALPHIQIGMVTTPIFIGDRWVLLKLTSKPTKYEHPIEDVEEEMRQLAKLAQERFLMERALQTLQKNTEVQIFDTDIREVLGFGSNNAHKSNWH